MTLAGTLDLVRALRRRDEATPVVLMGYFTRSGAMARGASSTTRAAGVDGLIVVDLPPEEDDELCVPARPPASHFIRLVTPTTDDRRLPKVLGNAGAFSTTSRSPGSPARAPIAEQVAAAVAGCAAAHEAAGGGRFGIRTPAQAAAIAPVADAVVIGSALVAHIADSLDARPARRASPPACSPRSASSRPPCATPGMARHELAHRLRPPQDQGAGAQQPAGGPGEPLGALPELRAHDLPPRPGINQRVCTHCGHHFRVGPEFRFQTLFDDGAWTRIELPKVPTDPLKFRDRRRYVERLKEAQGAPASRMRSRRRMAGSTACPR